MNDLQSLGRLLVGIGVLIVIVGGVMLLFGRIPFLGRLPGDIRTSAVTLRVSCRSPHRSC